MQKTFLHTRFYTDAFQNEARNAKSIHRSLPDLRIFSNICLHLISCNVNIIHLSARTPFLLLFPPSFFCFCLQKRRFLHIWNIWHHPPCCKFFYIYSTKLLSPATARTARSPKRQNAKKTSKKSPESLPSQYHEQYSRRGPHVLVWRSFKQHLFMRTAGREPAVCTHDT